MEPRKYNPPTCYCSPSPYNYIPTRHVITRNVNLVNNEAPRSIIIEGHKLGEPRSFTWCRNFIHIINFVEDYANRWANFAKKKL